MAHFAKINNQNIVEQVIVVNNNELLDENGVEREEKGIAFCQSIFGGNWVQTSYNRQKRKHFAGIGFIYDQLRDAFYPPQPFPSWTLNEDTCVWEAPVSYPLDGNAYIWNETSQMWVPAENL